MAWSVFAEAVAGRDVSRLYGLVGPMPGSVDDAVRRLSDPGPAKDGPALLKLAVDAELDEARLSGEEPHVDLTVLLLIAGADPRRPVDGESALELATTRGHWLAALVMSRWGRPPDSDRQSPEPSEDELAELLQAIEHERFRELRDLLVAGVDVHTEAFLLGQALAVEEDFNAQVGEIHLDSSALLLAMGADPFRPPRPSAAELAAESRRYYPDVMLYESWTREWAGSPRFVLVRSTRDLWAAVLSERHAEV